MTRTLYVPNEVLIPQIVEVVRRGDTATFRVRGYSMRPFLDNDRDKVIVGPVGEVQRGDVVLAEISPKKYVMHRVMKVDGEQVTLMGDGNPTATETCTKADVLAKVQTFIRKRSEKATSVNSLKWRIYSFVWMNTLPIRRILLAIDRRFIR